MWFLTMFFFPSSIIMILVFRVIIVVTRQAISVLRTLIACMQYQPVHGPSIHAVVIGASMSEPHIDELNTKKSVRMYLCMYICL